MFSIDKLMRRRNHTVLSPKNKTVGTVEKSLHLSIDDDMDTFFTTLNMMQLGALDSLHYFRILQLSITAA